LSATDSEVAGAPAGRPKLRRELSVLSLIALAVCTVIGGGINVLSVQAQKDVPGIGPHVPLAFVLGVLPALFAALCYAILASAMPRAGGGYVYISRALHPFWGFMATFSKWFGLATVIGVLAHMDIDLLRDAFEQWGATGAGDFLRSSWGTLWIPMGIIAVFWYVNVLGVKHLGITVIVLMVLMLAGGCCLIVTGFLKSPQDLQAALGSSVDLDAVIADHPDSAVSLPKLLSATAFLFFAYVGFATISQAGSEARNPRRAIPMALVGSTVVITVYYLLFSAAIYHALPWEYVATRVMESDVKVTAPGLMGPLMPPFLGGLVAMTAAIALANDIPPMLMAVSRLFFAWAEDGVFPRSLAGVSRRFGTPHWALTLCAIVASAVVVECHFRGDEGFFKGVDMVTMALLFTYLSVAVSVLTFPRRNPELYRQVAFMRARWAQVLCAVMAIGSIGSLLWIQISDDLESVRDRIQEQTTSPLDAVLRSAVFVWVTVLLIGAAIFGVKWVSQKRAGLDPSEVFRSLPPEQDDDGHPRV